MKRFPIAIDSSIRSDFASCQAKFYFQHILGYQRAGVNIHLHAGGCFAAACETVRNTYWREQSPENRNLDLSLARGLFTLIQTWGSDPYEEQAKSLYSMAEALVSYFDTYHPEDDPVKPVFFSDKPCVEFSFALPLPITHPDTSEPLIFCGRYDELGSYQNQLWSVDEKTASQFGPTWSQQFELRGQFLGYSYAAQAYGYPVAGAIVRGTKITKKEISHQEAIILHTPALISRWYSSFLADVAAMKKCYETETYTVS